ncbi:hypothetical protein ACN5ZK_13625 (plasmid) [Macrococcoides bohemicum]|uniref:hypothetical protein n=1 Tax=Macrococcoides bohemicum TaxID=1903056 RepID=UPI003AFFE140
MNIIKSNELFIKFDPEILYTNNDKYLDNYDLIIYCLVLTKAPYFFQNETRIYFDDLCRNLKINSNTQNKRKIQDAINRINEKNILNINLSDENLLFFEVDYTELFEHNENKKFIKIYFADLLKIFDFVEMKYRKSFQLYLNFLVRNNFNPFLMKDHSVDFLAEILKCDKRTCQRAIKILIKKQLIVQNHNGTRSEYNKEFSTYIVFNQKNLFNDYTNLYKQMDINEDSKFEKISSEDLKQNRLFEQLKAYDIKNRNLAKNNVYLDEILINNF